MYDTQTEHPCSDERRIEPRPPLDVVFSGWMETHLGLDLSGHRAGGGGGSCGRCGWPFGASGRGGSFGHRGSFAEGGGCAGG